MAYLLFLTTWHSSCQRHEDRRKTNRSNGSDTFWRWELVEELTELTFFQVTARTGNYSTAVQHGPGITGSSTMMRNRNGNHSNILICVFSLLRIIFVQYLFFCVVMKDTERVVVVLNMNKSFVNQLRQERLNSRTAGHFLIVHALHTRLTRPHKVGLAWVILTVGSMQHVSSPPLIAYKAKDCMEEYIAHRRIVWLLLNTIKTPATHADKRQLLTQCHSLCPALLELFLRLK